MKMRVAGFAALLLLPQAAGAADLDPRIAALQGEWARIKYQVRDPDAQIAQMTKLQAQADGVARALPGRAEPLIWDGIITSTLAGMKGGLGGLSLAKSARAMFEQAEKIDMHALDGSAETSLGSLYYQVPGFPIGFGSNSKAKAYLTRGLTMNPNGIDANYFWGDYLYHQGDYAGAMRAWERALQAPPRPGRELADQGRRGEIRQLMAQVHAKMG